ncbi:MAG: serine hydrolase domain-containing protein [bacterium]
MKQQTKIIAVFAIICLCACDSETQETQGHRKNALKIDRVLELGLPEEVGMSRTLLDSAVAIFGQAVDENKVSGVQLLVARRGKVIIHTALGYRDMERQLPMEKNTLIRMASNTKTVVATGILILAEEGRLDLNEPVSRYVRGFDTGLSRQILIKHLLTHTPGFTNQFDNYVGDITYSSNEYEDVPSLGMEALKTWKKRTTIAAWSDATLHQLGLHSFGGTRGVGFRSNNRCLSI